MKPRTIHLVCPEKDCTSDRWVNAISRSHPPQCGRHGLPRRVMVTCDPRKCEHVKERR